MAGCGTTASGSTARRVLVPFTGGVYSLYSLVWTLNQNVQPHVLYVTNLFPHNGTDAERHSVTTFVQGLRDYWHNHLWTRDAHSLQFRWNLTVFTIPEAELSTLRTRFDRLAYLAVLSSRLARDLRCQSVVWNAAASRSDTNMELDLPTLQRRTDVMFVAPRTRCTPLDYLYAWYCDNLAALDTLSPREDGDYDALAEPDDPSNPGPPTRFVGNFDADFPFWRTVHCCQRPRTLADYTITGDPLPNLCQQCPQCTSVFLFVTHNVDEFMVSPVGPASPAAGAKSTVVPMDDDDGADTRALSDRPRKRHRILPQ